VGSALLSLLDFLSYLHYFTTLHARISLGMNTKLVCPLLLKKKLKFWCR